MNAMLTTAVVALEVGLSHRMLDYWVRSGVITPSIEANGSGSRRRFSQEQVDGIRTFVTLRNLVASPDFRDRMISGEVVVRIEEVANV